MNTLKFNFQDTDTLYSIRRSGADLSQYHDQLARERSARTLTLRRTARPTIAGVLGKAPPSSTSRPKLFDTSNFPYLDVVYAADVLRSGNDSKITEFLSNIQQVFTATPRLTYGLITSEDLSEPLNEALMNSSSEATVIEIIKTITMIYPKAGVNQEKLIDDGLAFTFLNYMQTENQDLLIATITCIDSISEISSYARDSILCTGILTDLIRIATSQSDIQLIQLSCDAIDRIFANPEPIESSILKSAIYEVVELLNIQDLVAMKSVLQTIVSITNKKPSLVFIIYEMQIAPNIVQLLEHQELASAALPLIGNMSVSSVSNIKQLLDAGLIDLLFRYISTEYTSDVFWVLSNLIESVPQLLVPVFDSNFILQTISSGEDCDYELKREISFFIATLIIFTPINNMEIFITADVVDLLQSMLVCGVGLIVLRVLDALTKLMYTIPEIAPSRDFADAMTSEEMNDEIDRVIESGTPLMIERAHFLTQMIEELLINGN